MIFLDFGGCCRHSHRPGYVRCMAVMSTGLPGLMSRCFWEGRQKSHRRGQFLLLRNKEFGPGAVASTCNPSY
jgi:hypothetical protein